MDILISFLSFLSTSLLGLLALKKDIRSITNRIFFLLCLGFSFTILFQTLQGVQTSRSSQLFFLRLVIFSASFVVLLFHYFAKYFPKIDKPYKKWTNIIFVTTTIIIMILNLTPLVFMNLEENGNLVVGPLIPIYMIHLVSNSLIGLGILVSKLTHKKRVELAQIKLASWGLGLTFSLILITNVFFPIFFNINSFVIIGNFAPLIFASVIYYSIIKHRLLNINLAIRRFLITLFSMLIIVIFDYFVLFSFFNNFIIHVNKEVEIFLLIILTVFIILSYKRIQTEIEIIVDKFLFNKITTQQEAAKELVSDITNEINIDMLSEKLVNVLERALGATNIQLQLFFEGDLNQSYETKFFNKYFLQLLSKSDILQNIKRPTLFNEVEHGNTQLEEDLYKNNFVVLLPIYTNNKLIAYFTLGEKSANDYYSTEDFILLDDFVSRTGVSVYNAMLYRKTQNFNEELKEKVNEATLELQKQKAEVEDRYRTERDMVGIMGHELRTPLTSARGFLEIAVTKAKNNPDLPVKDIQHYLDNVFEAFKREIDLVQTMLSTSHVDNNKLKLDLVEVDLDGVVKGAMMDFTPEADKKNLILEYHSIENLPHIKSDPSRTIEVVNNLVSNAIKYTPSGRVDILLTYDDQFVYYAVKDTGEGIPESEIPNIGKKFYRVQNYIENQDKSQAEKAIVRPGGTGLGMYIVKAILEATGGELRIQSKVGEGSTFTAVFPRWQ